MELRQDYRAIEAHYRARRTPDRIIAHYTLERQLADELRNSNKAERDAGLYQTAYTRLLDGLPDHPRKTLPKDKAGEMAGYAKRQAGMLARELKADDVFVELGGGDGAVTLGVAPHVAKAIVIEVSDALAPQDAPANFEFLLTKGVTLPLPSESVSFVYSNQLMEHLHPDDAFEQMQEVVRVLKPGGRYLCRTPSRYSGPHDVSMFFSDVAQGMHLKEYSYKELRALMRKAGFGRTSIWIAPRAYRAFTLPQFAGEWIESLFGLVPRSLHTKICRSKVARALLGVTMMAEKPKA
ncbi:MAG: class I SAM-dependent methyltransferase [Hyphomonadaceae bacterium]